MKVRKKQMKEGDEGGMKERKKDRMKEESEEGRE